MSIKAMTWIWEHSPAQSTHLLMLLALADHCDDDGVCYPSVGRLAKKCRVRVRRAQQVLEALKQTGELGVVLGCGVERNGGKTNRYYLNGYRRSIGLPPEPRPPVAAAPPAASCRGVAARSCTTPPAEDCTQTVSGNRHGTRHSPHTHDACSTAARVPEAISAGVCVGKEGLSEQEAFLWAAEHPFWSTRITNQEALRRNLAEGKAFRAQFLAARSPTNGERAAPGGYGENQHASHQSFSRAAEDYHTAFWKRFGGTVRGTLLDPAGGD